MRGFGMFVELFIVELISGVETGMQMTVNVDGWPAGVWSEVAGRKFGWQEEQMFVYWIRQLAIVW